MHGLFSDVLSQVAAQVPAAAGENPLQSFLVPLVVMIAIFYLLILRPQSQQMKKQRAMLAALKKGDEVVAGGILGKIYAVADKVVTVEVASNVRIRVLKSSVQLAEPAVAEGAEAKAEAKKEETK